MKKIAIFVEGATEQLLVVNLVKEIINGSNLQIELAEQFKGKISITGKTENLEATHYILVVDCHGDEQVKTQIRENHANLTLAGYSAIFGLRDVYPFHSTDVDDLRTVLQSWLPEGGTPIYMHLAIMEVEAWFLAEITHFGRIHHSLTHDFIEASGINIRGTSAESWPHPAQTLHDIYRMAQASYLKRDGSKTKRRVMRTLTALSMTEMKKTVTQSTPGFRDFFERLENSLLAQ